MRSKEILMKVEGLSPKKLDSSYFYLIGFLCCIAIYYAVLGKYNVDEIEAFHTAWKISIGERIYQDFFQHHHPLLYYLLVPVIKLGGESLVTLHIAETLAFMVFVVITVISFFLARKIYDVRTALISIILLLSFPFFIKKGTEIRPDILQTLFGLASFYLLTIYMMDEGKRRKYFLASALLLSLSFLALQKAIFLVFLIGAAQLYWLWKGKITKKDFLLYWTVFLILPAVYLGYLLNSGILGNYFDLNWLVNMKYPDSFSPIKYFLLGIGFFSLFVHGCFLRKVGFHGVIVFMGVGLLGSIFLAKMPYTQWFLSAAPFASMVAACSLQNLFSDLRTKKICLAILVLFCTGYLIYEAKDGRGKRDTISRIEYVLSISEAQDTFYGGRKGVRANLFRKDVDFFWFCVRPKRCLEAYQSFRDYDYDPISLIKKHRPKIVFPLTGLDLNHPEMRYYQQSLEHELIYVRKR